MSDKLADIYTQLKRAFYRGVGLRFARQEVRELFNMASEGIQMIAAERKRQIDVEGWTPDHDDEHDAGELAQAAAVYAMPPPRSVIVKELWPWTRSSWKPTLPEGGTESTSAEWRVARIRDLTKAGALIAAEIDRLQRKGTKP